MTVHPDQFPELDEITVIEMTEIIDNGVPPGSDTTRGAKFLLDRTQSVITVQANDAHMVW